MSVKLVVAITGASGAIYGARLLLALKKLRVESFLIVSRAAQLTLKYETGYSLDGLKRLADHVYEEEDMAAPISSGSFKHDGMIIAPCSTKTLSAVANGYEANLVSRAAMVCLKERRRLVLLIRESPFSLIHLKNMTEATLAGAIVVPASPSFYNRPASIEEMVDQVVGRLLDLFGIEHGLTKRWSGPPEG
jgi:4-hydroxy-3-polyprenylbenzoate decarboxylase